MDLNMQRVAQPMWGAVVWSGIGASILFLIVQTLLVWFVMGISPWAPPRAIAAMVLGAGVLQPPTFAAGILIVAVIIHFIIAIILAAILASLIVNLDLGYSLLAGVVFGVILYVIAFYGLTAFFPWLAAYRGWVSLVSYVVFGLALAGSYKILDPRASTFHPLFARR